MGQALRKEDNSGEQSRHRPKITKAYSPKGDKKANQAEVKIPFKTMKSTLIEKGFWEHD